MSNLTRLTDIQLSFLHVNPLSDVSFLDALTSFACVRRYAPFPPASHVSVSRNAVGVRYAVVRFNRVGIKLTFCYCLLKRTSRLLVYHNLILESGPVFRWQYITLDGQTVINLDENLLLDEVVIRIHSHRVTAERIAGERGNSFRYDHVIYAGTLIENITNPDIVFEYE